MSPAVGKGRAKCVLCWMCGLSGFGGVGCRGVVVARHTNREPTPARSIVLLIGDDM